MSGPIDTPPAEAGPVDAVIVLGAALAAPGVPGPALVRRVEHGVKVFRNLNAARLVLSGGVITACPAEAVVMRGLALSLGVLDEDIVLETQSSTTFENGVFCGRIMRREGWRRVIVVTDTFHLSRALYVFRRLGLNVEGSGVPRPENISGWSWFRLHAEERLRFIRSAFLFLLGRHRTIDELTTKG